MTVELPSLEDGNASNLKRWEELGRAPDLAGLPHRIETDRFGRFLMAPPPTFDHADRASKVFSGLVRLMPSGRAFGEVPVSTSDGVKVNDVAWFSAERLQQIRPVPCLTNAPELCVEVLSPTHSDAEMRALYLEAGAAEVWLCALDGAMAFHDARGQIARSALCPGFPIAV